MQLVSTKDHSVSELVTTLTEKKFKEAEYNGKPVFHFRSMLSDMSQLGSDLTVEPFDDFDF